uniref:Uncharacterized protein n=1 Tax=Quercus lobata TaxID=97700 RepID=A0A7N2KQY7_QUELO
MYSQRRHFNTEYWVPTKLTVNQLEMYCKILEIKAIYFAHNLKILLLECSIHLQVVERSPESSSTEAKQPNVEIAASGKLNLLGRMLEEINKQSLKALILYEPMEQNIQD